MANNPTLCTLAEIHACDRDRARLLPHDSQHEDSEDEAEAATFNRFSKRKMLVLIIRSEPLLR